jgi:hypothetical protein
LFQNRGVTPVPAPKTVAPTTTVLESFPFLSGFLLGVTQLPEHEALEGG